jgi:hypothetical protein
LLLELMLKDFRMKHSKGVFLLFKVFITTSS